jgi:GMP synthase-like glutamine amidotransferase
VVQVVLLQTDNVLEPFQPEHGDYPAMFSEILTAADIEVSVVDVRTELPAPGAADAYLITGSRHSVYDNLPWIGRLAEYLRGEIATGRKVVGICFGHQLLAHFFGGEVRPATTGWEVGVKETRVRTPTPWMKPPLQQFNLISSHKDQVQKLPDGATVTASSANCPVAGFTMGENVITFQGHPEFRKGYSRALMDYRRQILGDHKYEEGIASLSRETDQDVVGGWILAFLRS